LEGWTGAVLGFDINVIVLVACFAGVYLIACNNNRDQIRTLDLVAALGFLVLVILPIYAVSWVAVTGLSLFILWLSEAGSARRRGALILFVLTFPMLWSTARLRADGSSVLEEFYAIGPPLPLGLAA
jgi:hypothetical protein